MISAEPTTVAELLDALVTRGVAEEAPARGELEQAVRLTGSFGMQVGWVRLTGRGDPETLERVWKRRIGRTNLRLVVVADGSEAKRIESAAGALLVFGPGGKGPVRALPGGALLRLFEEAGAKPALSAVRHLADGFARYDRQETPGLAVRGLLTTHTLTRRFLASARWAEQRDQATHLAGRVPRGADWQTTLRALGYQLERLPDRGYVTKADGAPAAVVLPFKPGTDLAKLDRDDRPREGQLLELCCEQQVRFGLLASGSRFRLFDSRSSAAASTFLELDGGVLLASERPLLGLLGPPWLADGGFAELRRDARDHGATLWKWLGARIRNRALPTLARGLDIWAEGRGTDTSDEAERLDLQHASLTLLFRLMFLFYAESAGFLPMGNPTYRGRSLTALAAEAEQTRGSLATGSTALWDSFRTLVRAMRSGNPAWGVAAYNGGLFDPKRLEGAATLERIELADPEFGAILIALGREETGSDGKPRGVDYSSLEIGHLGNIYESLLGLRLSVADRPMSYNPKADRYRRCHEDPEVEEGHLLWQTHAGGRKAGGVYYTPTSLVRHLVERSVRPAYREHLARVRRTAERDPEKAAEQFLDFAVVDPACGSGHFLVQVLDVLADEASRFLARQPLPNLRKKLSALRRGAEVASDGYGGGAEDLALLRRLLVKHSVFGVDLSPMGAEIATMSLWLAAFVPGLSLSYLGRNVIAGNSLFGVADRDLVISPGTFEAAGLRQWLDLASDAAAEVAEGLDRTRQEYSRSEAADKSAKRALSGLARVYDLWAAESFGHFGGRHLIERYGARIATETLHPDREAEIAAAQATAEKHRFLHWPLAFPLQFHRDRPGFDAVVGNPPWEEVTIEELGFYVLYQPGLNSMPEAEREQAITELLQRRPELTERFEDEQERVAAARAALAASGYASTVGDPDLYKSFCQRYRALLRQGGRLGVVLPRSAFNAKGSRAFRKWLHRETTVERVDFLLNKGRWAFDAEPRYSVGLLAARNQVPASKHRIEIAGVADSPEAWEEQGTLPGVRIPDSGLGPDLQIPLLESQAEADLLAKLRRGTPFPLGGGRWRCFAVRELDETNDKRLWNAVVRSDATLLPLWKGESFDQYDPHGAGERRCPDSEALQRKIRKPRPGSGQLVGKKISLAVRRRAVLRELQRARVAFRDVTNRTNSRTVLACLVPPRTLLTNTAPYVAFVGEEEIAQSAALGVMNSLTFDWQARRYVEIHMSFFLLNSLTIPNLDHEDFAAIAESAARLSAPDERFADFAATTGVEVRDLSEEERQRLRVDIDARVARAWNLNLDDLEVMLDDFTERAVPPAYRTALRRRLRELRDGADSGAAGRTP